MLYAQVQESKAILQTTYAARAMAWEHKVTARHSTWIAKGSPAEPQEKSLGVDATSSVPRNIQAVAHTHKHLKKRQSTDEPQDPNVTVKGLFVIHRGRIARDVAGAHDQTYVSFELSTFDRAYTKSDRMMQDVSQHSAEEPEVEEPHSRDQSSEVREKLKKGLVNDHLM